MKVDLMVVRWCNGNGNANAGEHQKVRVLLLPALSCSDWTALAFADISEHGLSLFRWVKHYGYRNILIRGLRHAMTITTFQRPTYRLVDDHPNCSPAHTLQSTQCSPRGISHINHLVSTLLTLLGYYEPPTALPSLTSPVSTCEPSKSQPANQDTTPGSERA